MNDPHDLEDREDGLARCKTCLGAEGDLPTHCPGYIMTHYERSLIYAGLMDFKGDKWVPVHKPKPTQPLTP